MFVILSIQKVPTTFCFGSCTRKNQQNGAYLKVSLVLLIKITQLNKLCFKDSALVAYMFWMYMFWMLMSEKKFFLLPLISLLPAVSINQEYRREAAGIYPGVDEV